MTQHPASEETGKSLKKQLIIYLQETGVWLMSEQRLYWNHQGWRGMGALFLTCWASPQQSYLQVYHNKVNHMCCVPDMVTHTYNTRIWEAEANPDYLKSLRPAWTLCIKTLSPKFLKTCVALKLVLSNIYKSSTFFQHRIILHWNSIKPCLKVQAENPRTWEAEAERLSSRSVWAIIMSYRPF